MKERVRRSEVRLPYLKADWTVGRSCVSLTAVMCILAERRSIDDGPRVRIKFTCERGFTGRSGERGALALAHAFGPRYNKGAEEPPTTSHTRYTCTRSISVSLARL